MKSTTRPAFPTPAVKKQDSSGLFGAFVGTLIGVGLFMGTSLWAGGLLLVHHGVIGRSLPWLSFVALSALFHVVKIVGLMGVTRR